MGMMETKIVQVKNDPETINNCNEIWGKFGWNVLSIQVTHTQNTKTYTAWYQYNTGDATVETTTINYATITYQRDKGMENYTQLAKLENEFRGLIENDVKLEDVPKPGKSSGWKQGLLIYGCVLLCCIPAVIITLITGNEEIGAKVSAVCLIAIGVWQYSKYAKKKKELEPAANRVREENRARLKRRDERIDEILAEVETLQ